MKNWLWWYLKFEKYHRLNVIIKKENMESYEIIKNIYFLYNERKIWKKIKVKKENENYITRIEKLIEKFIIEYFRMKGMTEDDIR